MIPLAAFAAALRLLALAAAASPTPAASPEEPDIRAIVPPQPYSVPGSIVWLVVAGISLVLAGLVAWYLIWQLRKKPPAGPPLSPRQLAAQRLADLEARLETMDARAFGGEVCEVLRMYIGGEYRLQPERQTSPEFLASVATSHVFSQAEHSLLSEFLDGCDLLKFARADATPAGKRALLARAREFVEGGARPAGVEQPPPLPQAVGAGRF